jgi:hypothetical protein
MTSSKTSNAQELQELLSLQKKAVVCRHRLNNDGRDVAAMFPERFLHSLLVIERYGDGLLNERLRDPGAA